MIVIVCRRSTNLYEIQDLVVLDRIKIKFAFFFIMALQYCRRGASSGILLGAVTLPAVMMSKLVQLTRAISLHQAEQDGIFPQSLYSYYDFLC